MKPLREIRPKVQACATYSAVVGSVLFAHRKKKNLTQSEIAQRLGITASAYSRLEAGIRELTVTEFARVCEILGAESAIVQLQIDHLVRILPTKSILVVYSADSAQESAENPERIFLSRTQLAGYFSLFPRSESRE